MINSTSRRIAASSQNLDKLSYDILRQQLAKVSSATVADSASLGN